MVYGCGSAETKADSSLVNFILDRFNSLLKAKTLFRGISILLSELGHSDIVADYLSVITSIAVVQIVQDTCCHVLYSAEIASRSAL